MLGLLGIAMVFYPSVLKHFGKERDSIGFIFSIIYFYSLREFITVIKTSLFSERPALCDNESAIQGVRSYQSMDTNA